VQDLVTVIELVLLTASHYMMRLVAPPCCIVLTDVKSMQLISYLLNNWFVGTQTPKSSHTGSSDPNASKVTTLTVWPAFRSAYITSFRIKHVQHSVSFLIMRHLFAATPPGLYRHCTRLHWLPNAGVTTVIGSVALLLLYFVHLATVQEHGLLCLTRLTHFLQTARESQIHLVL
jgi:hypothetical protein